MNLLGGSVGGYRGSYRGAMGVFEIGSSHD